MSEANGSTWRQWIGVGVKSGGQLLIGGVETVSAYMVCLGSGETFDLSIVSSRWGLGLGGSGGAVAVLGFGFIEPYELHMKHADDWGVNVAFTEKLISKSVLQSLVFAERWVKVYAAQRALLAYGKIQKSMQVVSALESIRNICSTAFAGYEASRQEGGVVVIDIPAVGMGLEASAYITRGTMYVSNSSDMDLGGR